jgi:CRP/FNR family transcriptional regulator, cyclic AMP receptor protein
MRKSLIILGILDDRDLEWLIENGSAKQLQEGDYLLRQGIPVEAMYFLLTGTLSVELEKPQPRQLAEIESGEVVGEISLLDSRPSTASIRALDESLLLEIRHDALKPKLETDLGLQARLYKSLGMFLAQRMRSTILTLGYGEDRSEEDEEEIDEIEPQLLDGIERAAKRFELMVSKVKV